MKEIHFRTAVELNIFSGMFWDRLGSALHGNTLRFPHPRRIAGIGFPGHRNISVVKVNKKKNKKKKSVKHHSSCVEQDIAFKVKKVKSVRKVV